jgi:hypothetical protein
VLREGQLLPAGFAVAATATTTTITSPTAAATTAAAITVSTAAAAGSTETATTAATAAIAAVFSWTSFVYRQIATIEFGAVKLTDRCFSFFFCSHLDKAKAT